MQYQASQQPARPRQSYKPRKKNNRMTFSKAALLLLFLALLVIMYLIFPKEAGRHIGSSMYEGLVFSEVMSANSTAVPDENGEFYDWLEIYNGTGDPICQLVRMGWVYFFKHCYTSKCVNAHGEL